ncbi:dsRBD fold-containing protein [Streptomyces collinus]|uniref:dsRBD fold-containing protein n=1 Tax=Streptomyces collinus TaxID=42684 RepID=UPI0034300427
MNRAHTETERLSRGVATHLPGHVAGGRAPEPLDDLRPAQPDRGPVPEIGDELAVSRALEDLAIRLALSPEAATGSSSLARPRRSGRADAR